MEMEEGFIIYVVGKGLESVEMGFWWRKACESRTLLA